MRSRYAAYALGEVEHILRTTHPEGPHWQRDLAAWRLEVEQFSEQTTFERLEVVEARELDGRGVVGFRAHLRRGEETTVMAERSLFLKHDGRWRYHSGVRLEAS